MQKFKPSFILLILLLGLFIFPKSSHADITSGLVGYWKFDETSGTTAQDSSGNGNSGTLTNGPTWTAGKINNSLSFDGVNDYVQAPDNASLNPTLITISAWLYPKPDAQSYHPIVAKANNSTDEGYWLDLDHSGTHSIRFIVGNASTYKDLDLYGYGTDNVWQHVVATYDGSYSRIYLNGSLIGTSALFTAGMTVPTNKTLRIGSDAQPNGYFNGTIDEVRIYNRALSASEVTELYNYTGAGPDTTPPTISSVSASSITTNSATITWTTNEASDSQVEYGLTTSYGNSTTLNTSPITSHSQSLSGLSANTTYHYRVKSKDAAGNLSTSGDYTFTTASSGGTTYYVSSSSGNDSNNGTSQSMPWKTIAKVNSRSFLPGDSIFFKREDTWVNEPLRVPSSGTQGNVITFGAYGTGNLPKFDGNNQEHWSGLVRIDGKSWVTIENLEITNVGKACLVIDGQSAISTGVTIQNNEIHKNSYVGYMLIEVLGRNILGSVTQLTIKNNHLYNGLHNSMRLTGGVTNVTISNNTIHGFYHNGIDTYPGSVNNYNFTIFGNDIYDVKCGIYLPGVSYATVYDNKIHDDWKGEPYPGYGPISYGIKIGTVAGSLMDHITVRNNIIWNITTADNNTYALWFNDCTSCNLWQNTVYSNYNTILNQNNIGFANQNNLAYANTNDETSLRNYSQDPKFVNPTATPPDFHLQSTSPVIDKGVNVGLPYSGSAPDLGAYEYTGGVDTTPPAPPSGVTVN